MRLSGNAPSASAERKYQLMLGSVNSVGNGVTHRLQRISPDIALQYKEWTIPINVGTHSMILKAMVVDLTVDSCNELSLLYRRP